MTYTFSERKTKGIPKFINLINGSHKKEAALFGQPLLLFCIFDNEKLSQRTLEDTFNSSGFKALFGLGEEEKIRRSSILQRLSKIDSNYFKEIYEQMYERFSRLYDKSEIEKYNLIRVDSTIVANTCCKLKEGIDQKSGKKLVKFSFSFDGILPSAVEIFTGQKYSAEDNALAEAVLSQVKKEEHHDNIYVMDRGMQSTRMMKDFEEKSVKFIIRSKEICISVFHHTAVMLAMISLSKSLSAKYLRFGL